MAVRTVVRNLSFDRAWATCRAYEEANQMSSEKFIAAYRRGDIPVTPVAMRWVSTYEAMLHLAPDADLPAETDLLISA